ncbi:leucyl aminopeptidase [Tessaracoccus caeni]|uniref:leucyl aminopeptidase n=1 Tax=Tessaracoccus caeni TaxID=3031239 RepID=UPI0023DC5D0D|nr:leucyl aminopeptidase [Tessaracoccus caeni]MDF1486868.1 leucyl aminopeptidase [Tessaracoccus caeni]
MTASLTISKGLPKRTDVVVLGMATANEIPVLVGTLPELDEAYRQHFSQDVAGLAKAAGAKPDEESVCALPAAGALRAVLVGLGDADVTPERLRRATGVAVRWVASQEGATARTVAVSLELADPELVQAAGEGALLGAYRQPKLTGTDVPVPVSAVTLVVAKETSELRAAAETAQVTSLAVCQARDWGNTPPNLLYPETFAEKARAHVKGEKIAVEILDEKALEKGGYGGILAVGGGSTRKPRLVRLSYAPRGANFHLALVGKGITFDSGGLDIKPAGQMAGMKYDMSGAAVVIAATKAIAELGLRIKVTAYAAMAENLPSGSSYRSSDVMTMFDGQTVENYNTDAEGRLVMADAIARASQDHPDLIVDVATLTGACMVALGTRVSGLMASDDATADRLLDAAEAAGEEFWQLPITDEIRSQLKSPIADMRSGGKARWGGALVAGAFLQRFVQKGIDWAHLDIAGPAENEGEPHGYTPKGGTGVAVRTLISLANQLAR